METKITRAEARQWLGLFNDYILHQPGFTEHQVKQLHTISEQLREYDAETRKKEVPDMTLPEFTDLAKVDGMIHEKYQEFVRRYPEEFKKQNDGTIPESVRAGWNKSIEKIWTDNPEASKQQKEFAEYVHGVLYKEEVTLTYDSFPADNFTLMQYMYLKKLFI